MKRCMLILLALAAQAAKTAAQEPPAHPIRVEVASDPIDLSGTAMAASFSGVQFEATYLSNQPGGQPKCVVRNNGYATIDYTVEARVASGQWALGTAPGENVACLYASFVEPLAAADNAGTNAALCRDVLSWDFGTEDRLTTHAVRATSYYLARNPAPATFKGVDVPASSSERALRFRLDTPLSGDTERQEIVITIGAVDSSS